MPNKQASYKHLRQTKRRTVHNLEIKRNINRLLKNSRILLVQKNKEKSAASINETVKALDRAARKGILKKNTASRLKSRLTIALNKLSA
ncbi:MAG: 30S ribosomal protein S20 [Patescibacteria group bacterium]|jgi:small subunit ribosomal protein S20